MKIRTATPSDRVEIERIHRDAFDESEGPVVAKLAVDLLADEAAQPASAFLAEEEGGVVGCIVFSPITLRGQDTVRCAILAPLAVASDFQRRGIGRALIRHGLVAMESQGVDLVLVYGDPSYYSRFGFTPHHHVIAPYELQYPDAWMAYEITPGRIGNAGGIAECAAALRHPQYW